jgi:hypothetical protein
VSLHQNGEGRPGRFSPAAKFIEQLPVGPISQRSDLEESVNVAEYRGMMAVCHLSGPPERFISMR